VSFSKWNKEVEKNTKDYLSKVKFFYTQKRFKLSDKLDEKINSLQKELGGSEALRKLKNDNHSINLSDLLTNKKELNKTFEGEDRLIQKTDPIYQISENTMGRAQLYAPYKVIGSYKIPTFIFNIAFIWMTILALYITLRFDALKKLLTLFDKKY